MLESGLLAPRLMARLALEERRGISLTDSE
jgi:hypothetical protein